MVFLVLTHGYMSESVANMGMTGIKKGWGKGEEGDVRNEKGPGTWGGASSDTFHGASKL